MIKRKYSWDSSMGEIETSLLSQEKPSGEKSTSYEAYGQGGHFDLVIADESLHYPASEVLFVWEYIGASQLMKLPQGRKE